VETQDILEVWFRGCHSDVGGGDEEEATAAISRQWMLSEARRVDINAARKAVLGGARALTADLAINGDGTQFLAEPLSKKVSRKSPENANNAAPRIHESLSRFWAFIDLIPRLEIDNSDVWPKRRRQRKDELHAFRSPELLVREGLVSVHDSAEDLPFGHARVVSTHVPQEDGVTSCRER
jgi:hypothetical protein